jgi:hypothetical protein
MNNDLECYTDCIRSNHYLQSKPGRMLEGDSE